MLVRQRRSFILINWAMNIEWVSYIFIQISCDQLFGSLFPICYFLAIFFTEMSLFSWFLCIIHSCPIRNFFVALSLQTILDYSGLYVFCASFSRQSTSQSIIVVWPPIASYYSRIAPLLILPEALLLLLGIMNNNKFISTSILFSMSQWCHTFCVME
jgi:hypothetical protein